MILSGAFVPIGRTPHKSPHNSYLCGVGFRAQKTRPAVQFVGGDQDGFLLSAPPDKQHKENTRMTVLSMSV